MYARNKTAESPTPCKWRVGYWLSSKKSKKFNFDELSELCKSVDIQLDQLNLDVDISLQGRFDAVIHKLSEVIVQADKGDDDAQKMISRLEEYISLHPDILVFDPIRSVRLLCDRYLQYLLIQDVCRKDNVYTPPFVDLTTNNSQENFAKLTAAGVSFPCICKPIVAHGSSLAHEMCIIFGEHCLKDVKPPCVAQTFVPHNAVLYKVFVIGSRHFICPRPSLKNFTAGDFPTIFFHTHDVSKDGCTSELSQINALESPTLPLCDVNVGAVVWDIREKTGLSLFGLDMIVENGTGFHYIIDVNALPSYDGVPDLHEHFLQLLSESLNNRDIEIATREAKHLSPTRPACPTIPALADEAASILEFKEKVISDLPGRTALDSGIGSCTESDTSDSERKRIAALRIRQQQQQQQQQSNCSEVGLSRPHSMSSFTPSWKRIKKFYGIPKPLGIAVASSSETTNSKGVSVQRQDPSPPPQSVQSKPPGHRKPRSQTLP